MKDHESNVKAIGLDIGTSRIVTAQHVHQEFRFQSQRNAFVTVPFSKITLNLFQKENIPHKVEGAEVTVYGNESERLANLFHCESRRPMADGGLNPNEPNSLAFVRQIVSTMLPNSRPNGTNGTSGLHPANGRSNGRKLCFSIPGPGLESPEDATVQILERVSKLADEVSLRQVLTEFGYEVTTINEGLAVVLAELEDSNYTGIGISCGGGMCNICLAYLSVPIFTFSIPKAGDFIDASAAAATGEGATRIRAIKEESFDFNSTFPGKIQQAINLYYDEMIETLVRGLETAFSTAKNVPRLDRPIPLVLSGGTASPAGFRDRFETIFNRNDFPVTLSDIRVAPDPLHSTAKGALVAALAEV